MRKIIGIVFALALFIGVGVVSFAENGDIPDYIRVGIKSVSPGTSYSASFSDGFSIYEYSNGKIYLKESFADKEVEIVNKGDWIQIMSGSMDSSGEKISRYTYYAKSNYFIGCRNMENGIFTFENESYRGGIMLKPSAGSSLEIVNVINIEKYLYGVVPREMSSCYPVEALKAQAVAARSYAICNIGRHNSLGFDVCTTQCCQVYGGVDSEVAKCSNAVDTTRRIVAYYEGKPAACYYSANNGGYIESSNDIWEKEIGYLQSKNDDYNPEYNWEVDYTPEELSSALNSRGYDVGLVNQVRIISKTKGGSVTRMEISGSGGNVILDKNEIRAALGSSCIKSLNFNVSYKGNVVHQEIVEVKGYVEGKTEISTEKILSKLSVLDGYGKKAVISEKSIYIKGKVKTEETAPQVIYLDAKSMHDDNIIIRGKGNGHCVGMSQQGAKIMAEDGFTYNEILDYYYSGITIE